MELPFALQCHPLTLVKAKGESILQLLVAEVTEVDRICTLTASSPSLYIYIYVAIHALASMPSAPRLSEADSKTSTGPSLSDQQHRANKILVPAILSALCV
jgi:hypothetical protein